MLIILILKLSAVKNKRISELKLQIESDRQRNIQQTNEDYSSVIDNQKRYIRNWEYEIEWMYVSDEKRVRELQGAVRLAKARVQQYEKEKQNRIEQINETAYIEIQEDLLSLNLINII